MALTNVDSTVRTCRYWSLAMTFFSRWRSSGVTATLYSKAACPLCHEAERAVRRVFGGRCVDVVDIIGDRHLEDLYIFRIPVLVVNGRVMAEGRITMAEARSAHQQARAKPRSREQD